MTRDYRQFCGVARAMELVGGRWALLIIRDLLTGPKRYTDLLAGLPGIPTNVLSTRLRELEDGGIVRRALLPRPASGVTYELTEYGRDLESAVVSLGVWGARSMRPWAEDDYVSVHALGLVLRGLFVPEAAGDTVCHYELRINGAPLRITVRNGALTIGGSEGDAPDVVLNTDANTMHGMVAGLLGVDDAVDSGRVRVEGSRADARRFFEMFRLEAPLTPAPPVRDASS